MAPTKPEAAAPPKPKEATAAAGAKAKKGKVGKPRNYDLGNGVYRFSRSRMYHKKALYKFVGKKTTPKKPKVRKPVAIEKPIGGEKNGGKRLVLVKKRRNYYPTQDK